MTVENKLHAWVEYKDPVTGITKNASVDNATFRIGTATTPAFITQDDSSGTPRFIVENRHLGHHLYLNDQVVRMSELTHLDEIRIGRAHYIFHMAYRSLINTSETLGTAKTNIDDSEQITSTAIDPEKWPLEQILKFNTLIILLCLGAVPTALLNQNKMIGVVLFAMLAGLEIIASILTVNTADVSSTAIGFAAVSTSLFAALITSTSAVAHWTQVSIGTLSLTFGLLLAIGTTVVTKKFQLSDWRKNAIHWIISFGLGTIWIISVRGF